MCEPTNPMDQHEQPEAELPLVSGQNSEDVNPPKLLVISCSSTQMLGDAERRGIYDAGDDACSLAGKDKPRSLSPPFFGIHDCKRETEEVPGTSVDSPSSCQELSMFIESGSSTLTEAMSVRCTEKADGSLTVPDAAGLSEESEQKTTKRKRSNSNSFVYKKRVKEETAVPCENLRLRVAIVGGGIGGLALATFLASSSFSSAALDVTIYEASPSLTELGAGVGIWLRTWRILTSISSKNGKSGLEEDLTRIAPSGRDMSMLPRKAFEFHSGDREDIENPFYTMIAPFGVLTLHRADFQQVLASHSIPPAKTQFNKRLASYKYEDEEDLSSPIVLHFSDGTVAQADILVGADGIRSTTRKHMYRKLFDRGLLSSKPSNQICSTDLKSKSSDVTHTDYTTNDSPDLVTDLVEPIWSGTLVYRSLIPSSALEAQFPGHRAGKGPVVYFGKNRHVIAFPIEHTTAGESASKPMINLVAFTSKPSEEGTRIKDAWVRTAHREELLLEFEGWNNEVLALLELAETPSLWAVHTIKPLPRYSDGVGRVVLLGDAAHAMTPHQGAGGGQAIEDAYVLAALLAHPLTNRKTLPLALHIYDEIRIPISRHVTATSRLNGMMYEFNYAWPQKSTNSDKETDEEQLLNLARAIIRIHKWEWEEPKESQVEKAVSLFVETLNCSGSPDKTSIESSPL